ncbi:MAG: HAD family hydrolase [Muribaculaceae bacterium]|nr:HAD family hydrolase [Muribaculaceae bacterium]
MKKLVIFDLDGTLLNTIQDLGVAANYALELCGYPVHEISAYPFFVGNGITRLLERVLPEGARSVENVSRLREYFMDYYEEHKADYTTVYDGVRELLVALSERGIKLAVASNKYHKAVVELIKIYFPGVNWVAVEGQKEGYPVKPDPSIVFDILIKSPTPKSEVLYVGDSGVDMVTARRAGIESVGVSWGFRPLKELREYLADNIATHPLEILSIVDK